MSGRDYEAIIDTGDGALAWTMSVVSNTSVAPDPNGNALKVVQR